MKTVSIILPCYNEEQVLPLYFKAVDPVLKDIPDYRFEFILVNDGSKDQTLSVMENIYKTRDDVTIVNLSRNFGQNPALNAGLSTCQSDYAIMMDCDLQDPVTLLKSICEKFSEGYDVVSPHRTDRRSDSVGKRTTAGFFYRFTNWFEGKKVLPENVNCFRGLSRRAIDAILKLPESDRLLVAEIPFVGFKTYYLDFTRQNRAAGKTKYNYSRMFFYALDIISSSTAKPLYKLILVALSVTGFFGVSTIAFLVCYILSLTGTIGYLSAMQTFFIVSAVFFAVGLVLTFVGILGIYVHNILVNTRNRPNFMIQDICRHEEKESENE